MFLWAVSGSAALTLFYLLLPLLLPDKNLPEEAGIILMVH